jgi:protein-L-isoaspartate(D-aspartate) O-methyltransferase
VFTVEIVEEFADAAGIRIATLGLDAEIKTGDGSRGWVDHAPYDRILVTAAAREVPAALGDQLAEGGRMVIPLGGKDVQQLTVIKKGHDGGLSVREIMPVRFTLLES